MVSALPRYRHIGDEPLYCEADPAEVLYRGSDDEDYPDASVRKYKYEAAAVKFLEGKKPFILSATLRGPFDEASGWTNPWRSKGRSAKHFTKSRTPASGAADYGISQSTAKLRSIRHSIEDSFTKKAVAQASSSCHLPSPESLDRAVQHPYLDEDELVKLESWRSRVEPVKPSIDKFWAPSQSFSDSTNTRKRRAQDSGWLKRATLKRRRTDGDFDELDDLDNASILAQGFGMSQNTTIPIPILPPPESEVEDELNINVSHNFHSPRSFQSPQRRSPTRLGLLTSPVRADKDGDSDDELSGPSQSSQKPRTWRAASSRSQVSSRRQASEARSARSDASRRFIRQGTTTPSAKVSIAVEDDAPEFETQQDNSFVYRTRTKRASTPGPIAGQQLTSPLSSIPDDISDFTSLGTRPEELRFAACDVIMDAIAEGIEDDLNAREDGDEIAPGALQHVDMGVTEQLPPQQALTCLESKTIQVVENYGDDASFKSSDSESEAAVSVDEVIPSSQPAFDSSTLVECTTIMSATRSPVVDAPLVRKPEDEETISIEDYVSAEGMDSASEPENDGNVNQAPEAHEPSSPGKHSIAQINKDASTLAAEAVRTRSEEDAATNIDVESLLTSAGPKNLPTTKLLSPILDNDENPTPVKARPEPAPPSTMTDSPVEPAHTKRSDHEEIPQRQACDISAPVDDVPPQSPWRESQVPGLPNQSLQQQPAEMTSGDTMLDSHLLAASQQSPWKGGALTPRQVTANHGPLVSSASMALSYEESPLPAASQQSPWKCDEVLPQQSLFESRTAPAESACPESQSPWARSFGQMRQAAQQALHTASISIMGSFTCEAQHTAEQEKIPIESGETSSVHTAPSTPTQKPAEPSPVFTLKPFSDFRSPPQPSRRNSRNVRISGGHLPSTQSILLGTGFNPWGSSPRSRKRVSWGVLPNEAPGTDSRAEETPGRPRRAASPPPEQALDDLPTSEIDTFHNHFSAIKQKVKGHRHRILPTASQQVLRSPSPTAMAEAFVAADELAKGSRVSTTSSDVAEHIIVKAVDPIEDNGSDSGDDVADVLMNLDSFIDAMDVEADVKQAKAEGKPMLERSRNPFSMTGRLETGVWDD